MIRVCVKVLDAPFGQHSRCTNFWTEADSASVSDLAGILGIFSSCKWFSIWVLTSKGMSKRYDSSVGFVA